MKLNQFVGASAILAVLTAITATSQAVPSLTVDFQASIASEGHPTYGGEARYFHVSTNAANPGTGVFAATIVGSNTPGPLWVRNYDGPVYAYKFAGGANNDITAVAQSGGVASAITFTTTDTSFDGFGQSQAKIWTTTDPGSDIEVTDSNVYNVADDVGGTGGWRSLSDATGYIDVSGVPGGRGSVHIYYGAFSAKPSVSVVMRDTDGPEPDLTLANVHLNDDTANRTEYYLAEIDFVTDGLYEQIEFVWNAGSTNGRGLATVVTSSVVDTTDPTLAPVDIVDDQSGGPFTSTGIDSITYTVTYSEFMDPDTIDASDFGLSGTAAATIDSAVHFGGVTTVVVTPTAATSGTLVLQVNATAVLTDISGNPLDTTSAIADDPAVTIVADVTAPTLVSIADNVSGGPILEGQTVVYTVTFDEPMKASSIETTDFEDAGSPGGTINSVSATGDPAVYEVAASAAYPAGTGTLTFQIKATANLQDLSGNLLVTGGSPIPAATINVNAQDATRLVPTFDSFLAIDPNQNGDATMTYDASGSDKLVIIATKEGNSNPYTTLTYEGEPLILAVSTGSDADNKHWNGIYYLDDPGSYDNGSAPVGEIVANSGSNRNIVTAVGLSDTAPGFGGVAAPPAPDNSKSVDLGLNFVDSMVIASHGMGQSGNTADPQNVDAVLPLIEMSAIRRSSWVGHWTGYAGSQGPGLNTYSVTGGNATGCNTIAAEFPGVIPPVGTPFELWAGTFAGLTDPTSTVDFDLGGLQTGIEWVVGGDPTDPADDAGNAPTVGDDGTNLVFTYKRRDDAEADPKTAIKAEYGSDLQAWTDAIDGTAGVSITVTDGSPFDTVEVKIPKALAAPGSELYARLNVTITP